ncbi:MAG: glycerol kinase GlpK [Bacilli bacterium]|jgi:glycerol kinase
MKKYILAIDQGTTSTRAILFSKKGSIAFQAQREVVCRYPKLGYVEQDALELWISVIDVINDVLVQANIDFSAIDSIGITNQRETTIIWDKATGRPIAPAIVWQSRQSADICDRYEEHREKIHNKTGLLLNPYFSASKIRYILENTPGAELRAKKGELLFGTVDTWIIYKLTQGRVHATDKSNASRTMLYNIFTKEWDRELLELFDIDPSMLPQVHPNSYHFGDATFFGIRVPIMGVAGDQQAALFGQMCFNPGEIKNTYGTGCFMLMNTGEKPVLSQQGLLTTIAWDLQGKTIYALEGSVFVGGAAVQWLRDEMKLIKDAPDSERSAMMIKDSEGVYFVPAFVGLGTPYWDDDVRGAIFGLTRATTKYHIVRATLEAIAYQSKDVIEVMRKEAQCDFQTLKVDGGATANNYLMQFQSDILSVQIQKPVILETTALGVAYLAGLATGFFQNVEHIEKIHHYEKVFSPKMKEEEVKRRYAGWKKAIAADRVFK